MIRKLATLAAALGTVATLVAPAVAQAANAGAVLYDSTPAPGTVSIPSMGPEAYSFNQLGNEVLLHSHTAPIRHVSVTMESWACQTGSWQSSCTTTPGAKFTVPITLNLYRHAKSNSGTGEVKPGRLIASVTKTFRIKYRPSSSSTSESRFLGTDGQYHNGIAQNIEFPVNRQLPNDVVWTVGYDTNTSGTNPLGHVSPADSLNIGLAPKVRVGHDRFPDSIFWDTRYAGFTCGAPFVTGELNRDGACNGTANSWAGFVPAVRFSTH
jgi:hypothetical protein